MQSARSPCKPTLLIRILWRIQRKRKQNQWNGGWNEAFPSFSPFICRDLFGFTSSEQWDYVQSNPFPSVLESSPFQNKLQSSDTSSPVQSSPVMVSIRAHKRWKRTDWNRFELAKMSLISVSLFRSISLSHKGQEVSIARKITRKFCCWRKFGICSTSWKTLQLISCNPLLSPTSFIALTKTERLFRLITSVKWRNNSASPWEIIEPPRLNALLLS